MMNKYDFALSLIRAPWAKRLTDRSFLLAIGATIIGAALFQDKAISGTEFVQLLGWTLGPWIVANQAKDAYLGGSAINAAPDDKPNDKAAPNAENEEMCE